MLDFLYGASPLFKLCVIGVVVMLIISAAGGTRGGGSRGGGNPTSSGSGSINSKGSETKD